MTEAGSRSISDEINIATRKKHAELNRLIIDRLPLGLPPNASDPAVLGRGLATFAGIYFAFEDAWLEIDASKPCQKSYGSPHEAALRAFLSTLGPPGLARSERLRHDISHISQRTGIDVSQYSSEQQRLFQKTRQALERRPHSLIAYAWVMYMALFSGGRWIRQQLLNAEPQFWEGPLDAELSASVCCQESKFGTQRETSGFSFLNFDDGKDGNSIKAEFKSRLAKAETLITEQERREVIDAARGLFDDCIVLVRALDQQTGLRATSSGLMWIGRVIGILFVIYCLTWAGTRYRTFWQVLA